MFFRDIPGRVHIKRYLTTLVRQDRVPHAQLITGQEGTGGLPLALALASYLLCTNRQEDDSCGHCPGCQKSHQLIHPDLHFSYPVFGADKTATDEIKPWRQQIRDNPYLNYQDWFMVLDGENKQGNINVDECRAIAKKLSLKSFESDKKILILWGAEFLGNEGNRLLKLIEEPEANTFIIILAEQSQRLLNTITSRCQLLALRPFEDEEIADFIRKNNPHLGDEEVRQITYACQGNLREALLLLQDEPGNLQELWYKWLGHAARGQTAQIMEINDQISALGREKSKQWLRVGLLFWRAVLVGRYRLPGSELADSKQTVAAEKLQYLVNNQHIFALIELFNGLFEAVERNANLRILLCDTYLEVKNLLRQNLKTPV